jgi:hypothetical protein
LKAAQTAFERFEFKYVVSEQRAKELLQRTASYLRSDDWAPGGQRITSLYLDSPERDFLQLHREGAPDRSKLRVRAYGDPLADQAFFEIKRKVKRVTFKHRAIVPQSAVPMLLRGELGPTRLVKSEAEQRTLEHFLYLMLTYRAEPTVLTTCCREAFTAIEPADEVRLTLDRDISYQPRARRYAQRRPAGLGAAVRLRQLPAHCAGPHRAKVPRHRAAVGAGLGAGAEADRLLILQIRDRDDCRRAGPREPPGLGPRLAAVRAVRKGALTWSRVSAGTLPLLRCCCRWRCR